MFDYVLLIGGKKVSTQDHNEEYWNILVCSAIGLESELGY